MSQIKGKNTKPEILVRKFLFANGLRYRLHDKKLPGKPDIVLPKYKTVIFVNGCFWHGHKNCKKASFPTSNVYYWKAKIDRNSERDKIQVRELRKAKWKVITVWECDLKEKAMNNKRLTRIINQILQN